MIQGVNTTLLCKRLAYLCQEGDAKDLRTHSQRILLHSMYRTRPTQGLFTLDPARLEQSKASGNDGKSAVDGARNAARANSGTSGDGAAGVSSAAARGRAAASGRTGASARCGASPRSRASTRSRGRVTRASLRRNRGRAGGAGRNLGAGEVEQRGRGEVLGDSKLHLVGRVRVTEVVPEGRGLVEKLGATNLVPVLLGVGDAGDGLVPVGTSGGPASLGDPDGLATSGRLGSLVGTVEQVGGVVDVVALAVLVVRVGVEAEEVDGVNDGLVGAVGPDVPGVDVADRNAAQSGVGKGLLEVADELDDDIRVGTDTGRVVDQTSLADTVEILAADGDTDDKVGELLAVGVDGGLESSKLLVNVLGARGPDTEEDLGVGLDGSREGLDRVALRVGLDVGIEADGVEGAGGVDEALSGGELGQPVLLELGRVVGEGGTRIEAEVVLSGGGAGGDGANGEGNGRGTHDDGWVFAVVEAVVMDGVGPR